MTGPDALSATALSKQVDVSQSTLSKWLRVAGVDSSYNYPNGPKEYTKMTKINLPKRPNDWSAEEKMKVVMEATSLDDEQLGEFLRKKGLHQTHLEQWRLQMIDGLHHGFSKKSKKYAKKKRPMPNVSGPWKKKSNVKTRPWLKQPLYWS
jgi:transposase